MVRRNDLGLMGYSIQPAEGTPSERLEVAKFLSEIAVTGDHPGMVPEVDRDPELWLRRFRWWWDENPFVEAGSPKGFLLRTEEGKVVGFQAAIPQEFSLGSERVKGLIAATLYVDQGHRDGATGLMLRFFRLGREYHIVDSAVSLKLAELMRRFGAKVIEEQHCLYLPLWRQVMPAWGGGSPGELEGCAGKFVTDASEIRSVVAGPEGCLRQRVTPESIHWFITCGSPERRFRGWVDGEGTLQAWIFLRQTSLGKKLRWTVAGFGGGDRVSAGAFVEAVCRYPQAAQVPGGVWLMAAYIFEAGDLELRTPWRRKVSTRLCHILPRGLEEVRKCNWPMDGDLGWL